MMGAHAGHVFAIGFLGRGRAGGVPGGDDRGLAGLQRFLHRGEGRLRGQHSGEGENGGMTGHGRVSC
jgi:hypothetical protein